MPIPPTTSAGIDATKASGGAAQQAAAAGGLGKDDFLKLLVGQLRNQDPLNPVEDQTFLAQMAAFSTLEQVTNLTVTAEQLGVTAVTDQALSLIGREVTYVTENGDAAVGTVERVSFENGSAELTIGGVTGISPGQVTEVR